jgi:hypothetical protein
MGQYHLYRVSACNTARSPLYASPDHRQPCLLGAQSRAMPCHAEPRFTRQYEHIWGRGKCSCSSACCTVSSHVCAAAGFNLGRCGFAACYGQDGMACQQQQALKLFSLHRPRPQLLLTGCSILPTISYQLPDIHAIVICRPFSCFFFFPS